MKNPLLITLFTVASSLLFTSLAVAVEINITSPADTATVAGAVSIVGTTTDLTNGVVSVSIDGGSFQRAEGRSNWSFAWDTSALTDGSHTITARARLNQQDPGVTETINISVDNSGGGGPLLSVAIHAPNNGTTTHDQVVVNGTSTLATSVTLEIDGGSPQIVSGVAPWVITLEPTALTPGSHILTVEASDGAGGTATDSVNITVGATFPDIPRPRGIFSLGGIDTSFSAIRTDDFLSGLTMRLSWEVMEPTPGSYDFGQIDSIISQLEPLGQKLNLEIIVFRGPDHVNTAATETWEHALGTTLPVPWDPAGLLSYENLVQALASHMVPDASQGGALVPLADHPVLLMVSAPIMGLSSVRESTNTIANLDSYDRLTFVNAVLDSVTDCRDAFPDKFGFLGFFNISDNEDGNFGGVSLSDYLRDALLAAFNGPGQRSLGLFRENLSDIGPTATSGEVLTVASAETYIVLQALTSWVSPFPADDADRAAKVKSGNPATGISLAYHGLDATFFEIYLADVDNTATDESLRQWAAVLQNGLRASPDLDVSITSPVEGQQISTTLTVTGTSNLATSVSLQIDGGSFTSANGLNPWDVVIEEGALSPGPHTLTVRAEDGQGGVVFDSVNLTFTDVTTGLQNFTYSSSVDGVAMGSKLYVPANYNPETPTALVCHLHGGGGLGNINANIQAQLDARGWIGIAPDGRAWGLAQQGCSWQTSAAYVDSFDPDVGPGEQDIFDAIQYAIDNFNIDSDRIFLTGFSMGGRGAYIIGLKNPDFFAAIGPFSPAIDMYEIFERRPNPTECKEGMVGGQPGDSPIVDTMYSITSGRFLIENAYNLPIFHGHGTEDTVANNDPANSPFLHGRHILMDTSWDSCFGDPTEELCFGHTPTLSELNALHPSGYDWSFMFTPVAHQFDGLWLQGAPTGGGNEGVEDSENPGNLIGAYQFFDTRARISNPATVVYKTYTDTHRKAYWTDILIDTPWMNTPGAIRATRDQSLNRIDVELSRVHTATFDLITAQLALDGTNALTIAVEPLLETVFDPALDASGEPLIPFIAVTGDFSALENASATINGVSLDPALLSFGANTITVGPLPQVDTATTVVIQGIVSTPGTFETWMAARGETDPQNDPTNSGINNLLTFALGADLTSTPYTALPSVGTTSFDVGAGHQEFSTFSYHVHNGAANITVSVEASTDLQDWIAAASQLYLVGTVNNGDGTSTLTLRETTPLDTSPIKMKFYRVLAILE